MYTANAYYHYIWTSFTIWILWLSNEQCVMCMLHAHFSLKFDFFIELLGNSKWHNHSITKAMQSKAIHQYLSFLPFCFVLFILSFSLTLTCTQHSFVLCSTAVAVVVQRIKRKHINCLQRWRMVVAFLCCQQAKIQSVLWVNYLKFRFHLLSSV